MTCVGGSGVGGGNAKVSSGGVSSVVAPRRLGATRSATNCSIAPAPPPIRASSLTPESSISCSRLYPRSFMFCKTAAVASCAPSAPPVIAAFFIRSPNPSTTSVPSAFSMSLSIGSSNCLNIRPRGSISVAPIAAPRKVAAPRSSSVAPAARARSVASPAPAPIPSMPAAGNAAGPNTAVGAKAKIDPMPEASL